MSTSTTQRTTPYFNSLDDAVRYYHKYCLNKKGVIRKIGDGEICIGMPPVKEGELAYVSEEGRWMVQKISLEK